MAITHAKPGQTIDIRPLGDKLRDAQTTTLIKTGTLEVIRLVVPAGKQIEPHQVPGEITVQCIEGRVLFSSGGAECEMSPGTLLYLEASAEHSLRGVEDSSLLLTILL